MTERNRVTPLGELAALPIRGAWTGNRGRLHEGAGREAEIVRYSRGDLWIICALEFHGRRSELYRPGRFTWLFFVDEAQALAAGHRPCGECRHAAYERYVGAWEDGLGGPRPTAGDLNRRLHRERMIPGSRGWTGRKRLHETAWRDLPDGAFVLVDDPSSDAGEPVPALVLGDALVPWRRDRYAALEPRPRAGTAVALTPPASLAVLASGYPVQIDPTALGAHMRRSNSD